MKYRSKLLDHMRIAERVELPLKRSFTMREQQLPITRGRRWHAVPDDLDLDVLHNSMHEMAVAWEMHDSQDAAFPIIQPRAIPEPGCGMADPCSLAAVDPEEVFPHASNGVLQKMVRDQKQNVLTAMREKGISEHDIPTTLVQASKMGREDLLLPRWMLDPKKIDAIEKSIRMQAYYGLPELKRLHESELKIASTNTDVFMETGWHPQQHHYRPVPRSIRESNELQKLLTEQTKAEETLNYVDPDNLVRQFLVPEAARDMQVWENPSLTLPWASPVGFFDADRRRGIEPEEVDRIQEGVDNWLTTGTARAYMETGPGRRAFEELLWRMKNRDGIRGGVLRDTPPLTQRLNDGNLGARALPRQGVAPGLIFEPALVRLR